MIRVMWSKDGKTWAFYGEEDEAIFDTKDAARRFVETEKRDRDKRGRVYRIIQVLTMFA
jgi:hypothetical protein